MAIYRKNPHMNLHPSSSQRYFTTKVTSSLANSTSISVQDLRGSNGSGFTHQFANMLCQRYTNLLPEVIFSLYHCMLKGHTGYFCYLFCRHWPQWIVCRECYMMNIVPNQPQLPLPIVVTMGQPTGCVIDVSCTCFHVSKSCRKKEIQHIKMGVSIGWPQSQNGLQTRELHFILSEQKDKGRFRWHTKSHQDTFCTFVGTCTTTTPQILYFVRKNPTYLTTSSTMSNGTRS